MLGKSILKYMEKKYLKFDDYRESPKAKVIEEANEMLSYFLRVNKAPPPHRKWRAAFRKRLERLKKTCKEENIPIPEDLRELERNLSGKKKDVYPIEKLYAASCLALKFDVEDLSVEEKKKEIMKEAHAALSEQSGLQKNMKDFTPADKNDYTRTIKRLLRDDNFLNNWKQKRKRHKKLLMRPGMSELLADPKKALQE